MKKYKLIKEYSGSPKLGTIIVETMIISRDPKFRTFTISGHDKNCDMGKFRLDNPEISPSYWEEIIEKDYEILSFKENNKPFNKIWKADTQLKDCFCITDGKTPFHNSYKLISLGLDIHSVKRLSDSEVFTVGDNTNAGIIKSIFVSGSTLEFEVNGSCFLNGLVKFKKPLLITEDGVDIFEGDEFYMYTTPFNDKNKTNVYKQVANYHYNKCTQKTFSTKEAAEEYVLMNKPCLSINDIESISTNNENPFGLIGLLKENLIELVKLKSK